MQPKTFFLKGKNKIGLESNSNGAKSSCRQGAMECVPNDVAIQC